MDLGTYAIWLPTLLLVSLRTAAIFLLAPVFSHAAIPARHRMFLALVIALAVVGRLAGPVRPISGDLDLLLRAGGEVLIGLTIGFAARTLFLGIELGAFHVSQQMGVSLAEVFDPISPTAEGPVRRVYQLLAIVIFLGIGGHRSLIGALMRTFEAVPPAGVGAPDAAARIAVGLIGSSFLLALKVAAPVVIALLITTAALGLLQRAVPQCNLLSTHLPVRAMTAMAVLAAALLAVQPLVRAAWSITETQIGAMSGAVAP